MKKAKRKVRAFINFLYREYSVPRIPIKVIWYWDTIEVNGNPCFGYCRVDDDEPEANEIAVVAGRKLGTKQTLVSLAHEFIHYLQWLHNRDMKLDDSIEEDAYKYSDLLVNKFLQNHRNYNGKHIDGAIDVWSKKKTPTIDEKIAILIDEGHTCDICKYVDCGGIHGGPNGPIYPPCADGMENCVDEFSVEEVWEERKDDGN